jgi:capsular exopolysaccharide synthesis family protein
MSRIDEALRRAYGPDAATTAGGLLPGQITVDDYMGEPATGAAAPGPPGAGVVATAHPPVATAHPPRHGRFGGDPDFEGKLVTSRTTKPLAVEQYRRLAAALHEAQIERGLSTILVTSAAPMEGKSITITNLALTLSEGYRRRVLLIDADLRRPSLHHSFGLSNTAGLSDGLRASGRMTPVMVSPYLSVLPAGDPDPNPLASLTSDRMQRLVKEASSNYQWVLLDAPPVSLMPDAHHVARLVDGVLVVIAARVTPYAVIERTLMGLDRDRVLGIVLNGAGDDTIVSARFTGGTR